MYFSRFTQKSKKVIELSLECAREFGHNRVDSEHLLLGLSKEGDGVASRVLLKLGITPKYIEGKIIEKKGIIPIMPIDLVLSPRSEEILEISGIFADKFKSEYIETEHILLGILQQGENLAVNILKEAGIDDKSIVELIIDTVGLDSVTTNKESKPNYPTRTQTSLKILDKYGKNLTLVASQNKIDPVIGREKEIERAIQILSRRTKNNPVFIGDPGVGKTSVAEGLAANIASGNVPDNLIGKVLYTLDMGSMLAGAKYRGEFEERIKQVVDEVVKNGNIILFIDELHTIIGAGSTGESTIDASNILKPVLSRGDIQIIGATTIDEYRKHIEKDSALERRFQPVLITEPTKEETIKILEGLREKYESHHNVKITYEAIVAAVDLSIRYITDRFLPDKAIDILDEACSRINLENKDLYKLEILNKELAEIQSQKNELAQPENDEDFQKVADLKTQECKLIEDIDSLKKKMKPRNLTLQDIATVIENWTKIPVKKITEAETQKLLNLETNLHKRIIGQEEAVNAVSRAIRRNRAGLQNEKRPPSFIFVGPTGVGKTELAKSLAYEMFGSEDSIIRIDMSEYMESHSTSKLIGAPPGYVGYDEAGQLTEKVKRKPYSIILLDEIEKAHPDVFNILLQVLDDGKLTDSQGNTVSFANTIIIMTSNAGSNLNNNSIGFGKQTVDKSKIEDSLKETFRPEFLNRVDEIIVFNSLNKEELLQIVDLMLADTVKALKHKDISFEISDSAKQFILDKGTNIKFGARPLRRAIQRYVEDEISEMILRSEVVDGQTIKVDLKNDVLTFDVL